MWMMDLGHKFNYVRRRWWQFNISWQSSHQKTIHRQQTLVFCNADTYSSDTQFPQQLPGLSQAKLRDTKGIISISAPTQRIQRCFIQRCPRNSQPQRPRGGSGAVIKRIALPYIKNVSGMTYRAVRSIEFTGVQKLISILCRMLLNSNELTSKLDRTDIIYKTPCYDCTNHHVEQTGRELGSHTHEHKLVMNRHAPFALVSRWKRTHIYLLSCGMKKTN